MSYFLDKQFTGKQLDEETGLLYFGARYLDPQASMWLSADPAMGEYIPVAPINDEARKNNQNLPGIGGVFNAINLHTYHYAGNNPVKYIDPDGKKDFDWMMEMYQDEMDGIPWTQDEARSALLDAQSYGRSTTAAEIRQQSRAMFKDIGDKASLVALVLVFVAPELAILPTAVAVVADGMTILNDALSGDVDSLLKDVGGLAVAYFVGKGVSKGVTTGANKILAITNGRATLQFRFGHKAWSAIEPEIRRALDSGRLGQISEDVSNFVVQQAYDIYTKQNDGIK
jgi:RHS repeat-associated protein